MGIECDMLKGSKLEQKLVTTIAAATFTTTGNYEVVFILLLNSKMTNDEQHDDK